MRNTQPFCFYMVSLSPKPRCLCGTCLGRGHQDPGSGLSPSRGERGVGRGECGIGGQPQGGRSPRTTLRQFSLSSWQVHPWGWSHWGRSGIIPVVLKPEVHHPGRSGSWASVGDEAWGSGLYSDACEEARLAAGMSSLASRPPRVPIPPSFSRKCPRPPCSPLSPPPRRCTLVAEPL